MFTLTPSQAGPDRFCGLVDESKDFPQKVKGIALSPERRTIEVAKLKREIDTKCETIANWRPSSLFSGIVAVSPGQYRAAKDKKHLSETSSAEKSAIGYSAQGHSKALRLPFAGDKYQCIYKQPSQSD